jgi:hypothetical protein
VQGRISFETRLDGGLQNGILSGAANCPEVRHVADSDVRFPGPVRLRLEPDRDAALRRRGQRLRGYHLYPFEGNKRIIWNLEHRLFTGSRSCSSPPGAASTRAPRRCRHAPSCRSSRATSGSACAFPSPAPPATACCVSTRLWPEPRSSAVRMHCSSPATGLLGAWVRCAQAQQEGRCPVVARTLGDQAASRGRAPTSPSFVKNAVAIRIPS